MSGLPRVAVRHPDALTPQVIALDPIRDSLDAFAPQTASTFPRGVSLPVAAMPVAPATIAHPPLALAPRPATSALEPARSRSEDVADTLEATNDDGTAGVVPAASSSSETETSAAPPRRSAVLRVPRWLGVAGLSMAAGALGSLCTMLLIPPAPAPAPSPQAPLAALPFTVAPAAARPVVPVPARWEVAATTPPSASAPRATADKPSSASTSAPRATVDKPPSALPGFLSLSSSFPVRVLVDGVEAGGGPRLSLPSGPHTVTLLNDELEFAEMREVQIEPRKPLALSIETPRGVLHVNARPWADVWIDGRRVGETPVGNVSLPIGTHEVLLRHPQYGESRHTVIVGAKTPARLAVELQP